MEESPFRNNWSWFGFDGEVDEHIDYSWFRVQDSLTFDGISNAISDCSIFYSSRKPNLFLIRAPNIPDELWDATDCNFRLIPEIPAAVEVSSERKLFILWGCSTSLISLLIKEEKLPQNSLDGKINSDSIPVEYKRTTLRREGITTIEKEE